MLIIKENTTLVQAGFIVLKPFVHLVEDFTLPHILLQDSNPGLCWCDMGQICCFSPAGLLPESARLRGLRRTLTGLSPADSCKGVCRSLPESVESAGVHVLLQTPADSGRLLQDSCRLRQTPAGLWQT